MNYKKISLKIIEWLKNKIKESEMKGFVLGLSGGLDSSLVAILCKKTGYPTLGVMLPCHSCESSTIDAMIIAKKFNIETKILDLTHIYDFYEKNLINNFKIKNKNALNNIKPRLRMTTLYYLANSLSYFVVGTGNLTELKLGYFTKYGDGGVDLLPIGDLVKEEVRKISMEVGIPENIIKKPPSADLYEGQTDENEIGFNYEVLDKVIRGIYDNIDSETIDKIEKRIKLNTHKRELPPICIVH